MLTRDDLFAIEQIMDKKIKPVCSKLNKLQMDVNTIVRVFDSHIIDLEKRVDKLETTRFLTA